MLIPCKECKNIYSSFADSCPECACPTYINITNESVTINMDEPWNESLSEEWLECIVGNCERESLPSEILIRNRDEVFWKLAQEYNMSIPKEKVLEVEYWHNPDIKEALRKEIRTYYHHLFEVAALSGESEEEIERLENEYVDKQDELHYMSLGVEQYPDESDDLAFIIFRNREDYYDPNDYFKDEDHDDINFNYYSRKDFDDCGPDQMADPSEDDYNF